MQYNQTIFFYIPISLSGNDMVCSK